MSAHRWTTRSDDAGVVAVITALLAVVLFAFAALAVDLGRWYAEGQRLQRTVDAAAMAGVPYLPRDLAKARQQARVLIAQNGYDSSTSAVPDANITLGDRPSRLSVTMSSTIPNAFGSVIGARFKTVTRSAVADFAAWATMGSPCNIMGNYPPDAGGGLLRSGTCDPPQPNFWNTIAGPQAVKHHGDRYATRFCAGSEPSCSGTRNLDYFGGDDVFGQPYYVYRISAKRPVGSISVQVFDPMFVNVGDFCQNNLTRTPDGLWPGPASPNAFAPDAATRYAWGYAAGSDPARGQVPTPAPSWSPRYCTGDVLNSGGAAALNTSFAVLDPTDTQDPMRATPTSCGSANPRTFPGFSGDLNKALLATDPGYNTTVARSFRQWVEICTISNPQPNRDYYLLVRTNVKPATPGGDVSAARMLDRAEDPGAMGDGYNRYGLRLGVGGGALEDASISAIQRMPIYANLSGGTTDFYLARVTSANAGSTLTVSFFDTGDATGPGTIAIRDPMGGKPSGCRADGDVRTSPTGDFNTSTCTLSNVYKDYGYHGKIQRIKVPIPDTYSCADSDPTACWYRLKFEYPLGVTANDTTTWSASLDGDPVRLVK